MSFSGTSLVSTANPALFPGYLSGLILSTAGGSALFIMGAGAANDVASGGIMVLTSGQQKSTASWSVGGSGQGGLDTGSIAASTWYHVFIIKRTDTGVTDVLFSLDPASPTMPASYTLKRRVGSIKTDVNSLWTAFTQTYDKFIWATSFPDVTAGSMTSVSRSLYNLTVPTGIVVEALFRVYANIGAGQFIAFTSPQENDQSTGATFTDLVSATSIQPAGWFSRLTDTSARIGGRISSGSVSGDLNIGTYGWIDTRGK